MCIISCTVELSARSDAWALYNGLQHVPCEAGCEFAAGMVRSDPVSVEIKPVSVLVEL